MNPQDVAELCELHSQAITAKEALARSCDDALAALKGRDGSITWHGRRVPSAQLLLKLKREEALRGIHEHRLTLLTLRGVQPGTN